MKNFFPNTFNGSTLPEDATALFVAGILYGESQNTKDDRVYLEECTSHHENLDVMLEDIFNEYDADHIDEADNKMLEALPFFKLSMALCSKTNPDFSKWNEDLHKFRARDD